MRKRYFIVMYNWGYEYPRIVGGQHGTLKAAKEERRAALSLDGRERPASCWIEGFVKESSGEVVRVY